MADLWIPHKYRPKTVERQVLVYWINKEGYIIIPPMAEARAPIQFQRVEIPTSDFKEVERVSALFAAQKQRMFDEMDEKTIARAEARMKEIRSNLHRKMTSGECSQYEKDFIRTSLKRIEDDEHKLKTRKRELHFHMEAHEAPV